MMGAVLVVDDERSVRAMLKKFLAGDGHDVQDAEDARSAVKLLKTSDFDVVVTDINLTRTSGVELLKSVRNISPSVQVIMMTGAPTVETASESLRAGAFDYLFKPFSKDAILKSVNNALKIKFLADEKQRLEEENLRHREELERLVEARTESLRQSEETIRVLMDSPSDAAMLIDLAGKIVALNKPAAESLGVEEGELIGNCVYDFLSSTVTEDRKEKAQAVIGTKQPVYFQDETGGRFFDNRIYPVFDQRGEVTRISIFSRDITDQKRLEEDHIRLVTAIEQSAESVIITNRQGIIQYVNPSFERVSGYPRKEAIGRNPRFLKSGKQTEAFYHTMWEDLREGRVWTGHFVNRRKDGSLFEEDASISPVKDGSGAITHYVAVKRDVTDEIKLRNQLQRAQKMEALGVLAGGIAHDFNNILFPIVGFTEMSMDAVAPDSGVHKNMMKVLKAAQRAKSLVQQILAFSRQAEQERKPIQVKLILKEVLKLIRASLPTTIQIRQNIASESAILADPVEMHQILMNLITNAYQAMRQSGGTLTVALEDWEAGSDPNLEGRFVEPGDYVRLTVCDTGTGIDPIILDRIFDPYFSTKAPGEGTGLGLAIVHGIVTDLKGYIFVDSEPHKGTTFVMYIPRLAESGEPGEPITPESIPTGTERILLLDDEKPVCDIVQKMLESLGYQVTAFTVSYEALVEFKNNSRAYDMVLTDMTMPGLTGMEMARQVMTIRPDMPVILLTGYSELINEQLARNAGIRALILKPVLKKELADAIRKAIAEPDPMRGQ